MTKQTVPHKTLLIILDGWGIGPNYPGNAIAQAKTPYFDQLWQEYPHLELKASGQAVGLPKGQMGTSEVNHFTIGAGKVVKQDLVRINEAVKNNTLAEQKNLQKIFKETQAKGGALHVWGLVSDGGVHSHLDHLIATVKAAKEFGLTEVYVHVVTDGRDTSPQGGIKYVATLEEALSKIGLGRIVSVIGRYFAMDRDENWVRTDLAYDLYTKAEGEEFVSAQAAIQANYDEKVTDEFIKPSVIGQPVTIKAEDSLIMVNFRSDRPQQILRRFLDQGPEGLTIATMTQYSPQYPVKVIFPPAVVESYLGKIISEAGLKQLRVTETEKFKHLTYFLNCEHEEADEGEERVLFDSYSDIATHDERPEMRAPEIAQQLVEALSSEKYQAVFTNICNADMVGHTGNIQATIKGCEAVDQALSHVVPVALEHGYTVLITADHGNAEQMLTEEGEMVTAHTANPVPLIVAAADGVKLSAKEGGLVDVGPTILKLLGLEKSAEMTGQSLV